jgi:ubiquitin C-terminal hydrolase
MIFHCPVILKKVISYSGESKAIGLLRAIIMESNDTKFLVKLLDAFKSEMAHSYDLFQNQRQQDSFLALGDIITEINSKLDKDDRIFMNTLSDISCTAKKSSPHKISVPESNILISVPVNPKEKDKTLNGSLKKYCEESEIDNYYCKQCSTMTTVKRSTKLSGNPKTIIFHLKKYTSDKYGQKKMNKVPIDFPLAKVSFKEFFTSDYNSEYNLTGIISHVGTFDSGHYYSYGYNPSEQSWLKYDDNHVENLKTNQIISYAKSSEDPVILVYSIKS